MQSNGGHRRYFLIINPRSRNQRSRKTIQPLLTEFTRRNVDFDHVFVSTYSAIRAESVYANEQGYDVIVAVGGDGTINATINGFYEADGKRRSAALFGVIYTGTSPDFCKSYGIPLQRDDAVRILFNPATRAIRTGRIVFGESVSKELAGVAANELNRPIMMPAGTPARIFACCANIGLGAGVAGVSNRIRRFTGDFAGTLVAVLWNLIRTGASDVSIQQDEDRRMMKRVLNISVGRTKYIASGIRVPDGLDDNDQRLYQLTAHNISFRRLPSLLRQVYTGRFSSPEILDYRYVNELRLEPAGVAVGVECDGDPAGVLPCSISLAPDPLDLVVKPGLTGKEIAGEPG